MYLIHCRDYISLSILHPFCMTAINIQIKFDRGCMVWKNPYLLYNTCIIMINVNSVSDYCMETDNSGGKMNPLM